MKVKLLEKLTVVYRSKFLMSNMVHSDTLTFVRWPVVRCSCSVLYNIVMMCRYEFTVISLTLVISRVSHLENNSFQSRVPQNKIHSSVREKTLCIIPILWHIWTYSMYSHTGFHCNHWKCSRILKIRLGDFKKCTLKNVWPVSLWYFGHIGYFWWKIVIFERK